MFGLAAQKSDPGPVPFLKGHIFFLRRISTSKHSPHNVDSDNFNPIVLKITNVNPPIDEATVGSGHPYTTQANQTYSMQIEKQGVVKTVL